MKPPYKTLYRWYERFGRHDLPWRKSDDAYHIYLSEVMLQQTQVKTVLERYYFPFLKRFDTIETLASAPLDEVLKAWEGLGYYNRAKNLHKTAQILTEQARKRGEKATLPGSIETLTKLPGIGKNTAHAIAAFAFKKPVPVMEANVRRILCRVHRIQTPNDKTLWQLAYDLLDTSHPFDYNQAMMDIGATVCLPKNPKCGICPLSSVCQGKKRPELYPTKKPKSTPRKQENIVLYRYGDKLALIQREGRFLHGLWGFVSDDTPPPKARFLGEVKHVYTHFKLICHVYLLTETHPSQKAYFDAQEIQALPLSGVDKKILKLYAKTINDK